VRAINVPNGVWIASSKACTEIPILHEFGPYQQPKLTTMLLSTTVDRAMIAAPPTLPTDPADALAAVGALRRLADRVEDAAVERAVVDGWSWTEIAEALGVTRQAVHKKHARRLQRADIARGVR
jgi:DNA-directed RNA polymerase specialized sigma24 family protein